MKRNSFILVLIMISVYQIKAQENLQNQNLNNVNTLTINDPGINEGIQWLQTNSNWQLDVTPLNRSNADGNLNLFGQSNNVVVWRPLHIYSSTSGDAILKLEADSDNNNESDNSRIEMMQDGGDLGAYIGFNKDWGGSWEPDNVFRIGTRYAGVDSHNRLVIKTSNGNVGIGVENPLAKLAVDGFVKVEGSDGRLMLQNPSATASVYLRNSGISSQRKLEVLFGSTTKFTINNDGNVDIGSGIAGNPNYNDITIGNATSNRGIQIFSAGHSGISFHDNPATSSTSRASYDGGIYYNHTDDEFQIWSNKQRRLTIDPTGNIGIGTDDPQSKLAVDGQIRATEVKVLADISVPDYVFEPDYELRTLKETKEYIEENKHLPEIPSAKEIGENGLDIGDMNMRLLKKIEELTLYQIELLEKLEQQNKQLQEQQKRIENLENK